MGLREVRPRGARGLRPGASRAWGRDWAQTELTEPSAGRASTSRNSGRYHGIEPDLWWFDPDDDHGVLELHERLTAGVGLELHVLVQSDGSGTLAWSPTPVRG